MANTAFSNLPILISLNGAELVCVSQYDSQLQTWKSYTCTTEQISSFFAGITAVTPSMRQIKAAMAQLNYMVTVSQAVPADVANSYNIAWNAAFRMSITDPFVAGFLVPLLGQTAVNDIWALAPIFPI